MTTKPKTQAEIDAVMREPTRVATSDIFGLVRSADEPNPMDTMRAMMAESLGHVKAIGRAQAIARAAKVAELEAEAAWRARQQAAPEPSAAPVVAGSASGAELDYSLLATREELIAAFGTFTKMDMTWFEKLERTHPLYAARKVAGQGGRGHIIEPRFCPYEVMQWLISPKRRKGNPLREATGWRMLKAHFPRVHAAHSEYDPNTD